MARKNISSQKRSGAKTVVEVNKGAWTTEEDQKLVNYVTAHGYKNWRSVPLNAGLNRCGKSCRMRWLNYLRPGIKRGNITEEEEDLIIRLHNLLGNRWALIAGRIPGRTDNEIKNHWNTQLNKRSLTIEDLNLKHHRNATPPTLNLGGITTPTPITISPPLDDHRLIPNPILMSSSSSNTTTTTDDAQSQGFVLPDSDFNFEQLLNCPPDHSRGSCGRELGLMDDYYCINDDDGNFNYNGYYLQDHLFKFTGCDVSSNSGCLEYSS